MVIKSFPADIAAPPITLFQGLIHPREDFLGRTGVFDNGHKQVLRTNIGIVHARCDLACRLERLGKLYGPHWYARYVEGSWDFFEGQRFPMFDREKHVLVADWRPTSEHEVVESWDFGHRETFVVWTGFHPKRNEPVVVFAELQVNEVQEPKDVADEVKRIRAKFGLDVKRLLVLNAGGHGDTLDDAVTAFKSSAAQQTIFSKTDEAVKLGPAIDAAIRNQLNNLQPSVPAHKNQPAEVAHE